MSQYIGNAAFFRKHLGDRPESDGLLLAARSALRVLPWFNGVLLNAPELGGTASYHRNFLLPMLRCFLIAAQASLKPRSNLIVNAATHSIDFFDGVDLQYEPNKKIVDLMSYISMGHASPQELANCLESFSLVENDEGQQSFFSAFKIDAEKLNGSHEKRSQLAASALWPDEMGGTPESARGIWHTFSKLLSGSDGPDSGRGYGYKYGYNYGGKSSVEWGIWLTWYAGGDHDGHPFPGVLQGAKDGKYLFGLPTARALKLWHDVALIDNALWKGDPAALNAEFKRLVDEARIETAHQAMLDRIADLEKGLQTQKELQNRSAVIGHNNPPETVDAFEISEDDWNSIKEDIRNLKAQPPRPKDGGESAKSSAQRLKNFVSMYAAKTASFGQEVTKLAVTAALVDPVSAFVSWLLGELQGLLNAALHWLSLLI